MPQLTTAQYDALEHAITAGTRIVVMRRGTEYVVVPKRLVLAGGREIVEAMHPTTGHRLTLFVDEMDSVEAVR
ncbi:MAG: hypothetical protein HOQ11_11260 [Gemmatimonadaceae bacterium]|nr:hypothetical protein [Gemmatimonadaceae bacterium]NUQ92101.1 hypothetical protein [Gemmatimonadaceae bacterium]NUR19911.1 hypothetical protein [Gemmatimonadaceae bacterium]NUS97973.1 hypothetical protein [Gemmatimonadaceae bacterium]